MEQLPCNRTRSRPGDSSHAPASGKSMQAFYSNRCKRKSRCFLAKLPTLLTMKCRMRWVVTILVASAVVLRAETPAAAVRAMVEAERKFYQTGQEKGTRAAFLEFLADDAIIFRPGPV